MESCHPTSVGRALKIQNDLERKEMRVFLEAQDGGEAASGNQLRCPQALPSGFRSCPSGGGRRIARISALSVIRQMTNRYGRGIGSSTGELHDRRLDEGFQRSYFKFGGEITDTLTGSPIGRANPAGKVHFVNIT